MSDFSAVTANFFSAAGEGERAARSGALIAAISKHRHKEGEGVKVPSFLRTLLALVAG
jgi:hypothetical protein